MFWNFLVRVKLDYIKKLVKIRLVFAELGGPDLDPAGGGGVPLPNFSFWNLF